MPGIVLVNTLYPASQLCHVIVSVHELLLLLIVMLVLLPSRVVVEAVHLYYKINMFCLNV